MFAELSLASKMVPNVTAGLYEQLQPTVAVSNSETETCLPSASA